MRTLRKRLSLIRKQLAAVWDVLVVILFDDFMKPETGRHYNLTYFRKLRLILRMSLKNLGADGVKSDWKEHLIMAKSILNTPPELEGCVAECGCFKGYSTINLSIICKLTNRKLYVFDSFAGLPEPTEEEKKYTTTLNKASSGDASTDISALPEYSRGLYNIALEKVKANVAKFGEIEACEFVKGFFCDTLPGFDEKLIMVFEDADLLSSVDDCIVHLWPKLQENCRFYCHEPWSYIIVKRFYDEEWWKEKLDTEPPGFYGSGTGVPVGGVTRKTGIGFATKVSPELKEEMFGRSGRH